MSHVFTSGTFGRRQKKADPPVQDTYTLACCIAGDKIDFAIVVPSTAYIDQLAQSIYEKGVSNRFKCHILDMTLWKVCQDWRAVRCRRHVVAELLFLPGGYRTRNSCLQS